MCGKCSLFLTMRSFWDAVTTEKAYDERPKETHREVTIHEEEKEHRMQHLAEAVDEYDVSDQPEFEGMKSHGVAMKGSSTDGATNIGKEAKKQDSTMVKVESYPQDYWRG